MAVDRDPILAPPLADALDWLECAGCDSDFDNLNAIFFRPQLLELREAGTFWLSDRPHEPHSITWENAEPRFVTWARFAHRASGRAFLVYNSHLDHRNQPWRLRSIEAILSEAAERAADLPLVLTGDLNAKPHWPELDMLLRDGNNSPHLPLIDHRAELGADETVAGTFHSFDAEPDFARIDCILTTPHPRTASPSW